MSAIPTLGVIFAFIIAIVWVAESEHTKREKAKIQATLRSEEMARGYEAGTYSIRDNEEEDLPENLKRVRDRLEEGIVDLKKRINNMDANKKGKKEYIKWKLEQEDGQDPQGDAYWVLQQD